MAITSFDISCDKIPTKSSCSTNSSKGGNSCRLLKINIAADGSLSSTNTITGGKSKNNNSKSPYLTGDRVQLLSRVTEKRLVHKKTTDFVSSFPLAVNIYKANSDEFKSSKKANKKVKKSVLTLPNDPVPVPQTCTVSDMNDSEYCGQTDEDRKQKVPKKRLPIQTNRKARVREKDFEFYDRDAQYCSQLNINLDSSSTDMMKNFNGDGKMISNKKKVAPNFTKPQTANNNLSDVWTVLRNMNRFQFRPSPPLSEESIVPIKKKVQKRRTNRKDTRVIETCRTEEFAYISSYGLDEKSSHCYTPSSSVDRITVIDKKNEFSKICEEFEKRLLKTHNFLKDSNNNKNRTQKSKIQSRNGKNSVRAPGNGVTKETKQLVAAKKKKKGNSKSPIDLSSKSDPTNSNSVNRDSLGDGNSQITDNFDLMSHQTHNDSLIPRDGSFVYSDNSGSSKAELLDKNRFTNDVISDKTPVSPEVSSTQSNGTSKAVLIKGQEQNVNLNVPKRFDPQKRKPRLVTTMPSTCTMPKFTQAEIKRRLAHIRFPLLVLGRDQVSSNIPVLNYDPPQFDGLDKHIWPFMREWSDPSTCKARTAHKESKRYSTNNKKINTCLSDSNSIKSQKIDTAVNKIPVFKEKITANNDIQKKHENRRTSPSLCSKKQKSIIQLKEKMLNFLYKKSSSRNFVNDHYQNEENFARKSKTFISGNKLDPKYSQLRPMVPSDTPNKIFAPITIPAIVTNKKAQHHAYPWSKAKWASDFIENVIKKIKSGVYYTQDNKDSRVATLKEVSVQAGNLCDSTDSTQTYESDIELLNEMANTSNLIIPGFNNTQPELEIKTLNINQIAVKHCVTNVMLQFDVTVPAKLNKSTTSISKSLPLIPIKVTDSHTKVYKCNTTIFNAMLPAELCSILPKLMRKIIDLNVHSDFPAALCPAKTDSCLSTISELTRCETISSIPHIIMLTEIKQVLEGNFSTTTHLTKPITSKINVQVSYNNHSVTELLPKIWFKDLSQFKVNSLVFIDNTMNYKHTKLPLDESKMSLPGVTDIHNPTCTAMEVHSGKNKRLGFSFKPYNLVSVIESILSNHNLHINLNLTSYFDMLKLQYEGKNIAINVSITNDQGVKKKVLVTVSNLKIDSLYKASPKIGNRINDLYKSDTPMKCIEYHNNSIADKSESTEINQIIGNKTKRNKGFYKLYRKCKSTTNIPSGEKCSNTPLNKIANLEDFFKVLGSKKMLCSVFDGYAAKKILSSILEMKNWITEINPKQALLILLLTNKKDTPNLVRFRPILLQGIAVNRITRATELDMEIEVIERENLNKFSHYEGISYLPESVTNYDNLLEELYWIAKTTASDYQKPFDESSERLLKSLLEKRKKLNPSYLRVMARYVGLGLLKSPTKT